MIACSRKTKNGSVEENGTAGKVLFFRRVESGFPQHREAGNRQNADQNQGYNCGKAHGKDASFMV